jgi:DNA-binding MarR family transcriptional regulator
MEQRTYRDLHLLDELTRNPNVTQRELSQRLGVALGLTNLMLRRLAKKGYIKIKGVKRSRIHYLITPKGILEKSRLTYEFIQHSLQLYGRVRQFLRQQLGALLQAGHRRVVLYGSGELAEIALLTIRETGLELVAVVEESPSRARFVGYPVQRICEIPPESYDRLILVSPPGGRDQAQRLIALGIAAERLIAFPRPATATPDRRHADPAIATPPLPIFALPTTDYAGTVSH